MRPAIAGAVGLLAALVALEAGSARGRPVALIAFSTEVAGNTDVYVARPDGSLLRRVTSTPGADFDPSWSPDRRQIAYRCQVGTSSDICVVSLSDGSTRHVTRWPGDEWSPAWSPKGDWIALFSDHTDLGSLWLIHPDGTDAHRLVGGGEYPSWSLDGKRIAYADMQTRDIAIVGADGRGKRLIARSRAYDGSPSFSPSGRVVAFDSQRGFKHVRERGIGPEFEIYAVGRRGRRLRRLTRNHVEDRFPDFGPDGRIVFSEGGRLWVVDARGRHLRKLPLRGGFPDW